MKSAHEIDTELGERLALARQESTRSAAAGRLNRHFHGQAYDPLWERAAGDPEGDGGAALRAFCRRTIEALDVLQGKPVRPPTLRPATIHRFR